MEKGTKLLAFVQLLDSALPIGGFSHSFGLETYVQEGRLTNREQLENYIVSQLHSSLTRMEGLAMKGCYASLEAQDIGRLALFDKILYVQRLARESRDGLKKMGRRLLKLAATLYPWMELMQLEEALAAHKTCGNLPTIHAYINFHLGISCDEAVKGYLYSSVNMMINSALRLMAIGQTDGQQILTRMLPVIDEEWERVCHMSPDEMHSFSLSQEVAAMNHETLYSRLFMS